jgi:hypothetical protein
MRGANAVGLKLGKRGLAVRLCKGEAKASSGGKLDGEANCWVIEDEGIALVSEAMVWSRKSTTDSLQTAHCIAFSPTMFSALVRHPEHRGWSQGLRIATWPPSRPQTVHAVDGVAVALDCIFDWKKDSPKNCWTDSDIVGSPGPLNGSYEAKGSAEENDWGYGSKEFSSISKSSADIYI